MLTEVDADMTEMAKMQLEEAKERLPALEEEIKFMLIPKDEEDAKNVMVEIRAGTGGDEASIFAGDLFRMYTKYCERHGLENFGCGYERRNFGWFQRGDF